MGKLSTFLISKISKNGADKLENWLAAKSLSFIDDAGNAVSEAKFLENLDNTIGNKVVIETVEDINGRLLIQCERGGQTNRVYSLEINKNGKTLIKEYASTYKPSANTNIDVDISINKLAPDYTTKGGKYLFPKNALQPGQKNVVEITMTGDMAKDFKAANEASGFSSFGSKAPKDVNGIQYTSHHMDDFKPLTGKCTMQLVDQSAHTLVEGMVHSGGVAQYKVFNGTGY